MSNKRCADVVLSAVNLKSTALLKDDERQEPAVESSVVFGGHRDNLVQQPGRLRRQPCNLYERKANGSQPFSTHLCRLTRMKIRRPVRSDRKGADVICGRPG